MNNYPISPLTLGILIISSTLVGGIIGGLIGYNMAPSGGESFDLPEIAAFRMGFIPAKAEKVETITTNAQVLIEFLEEEMGVPVEMYPVSNGYEDLITAFELDQIDAAFLDSTPGYFVVETGFAEVVLAELRSDTNQPYYNAAAIVRANSPIDSLEEMLSGNYISSHTSATGTAGMIMPIGTLLKMGLMQAKPDDTTETLLARYFKKSEIGGSYGGALQRVLDGQADVAFVRDTSPKDLFPERADELRVLYVFGKVPSHPVVVNKNLAEGWKYKFINAMLKLNNPENIQILSNLYGAVGLVGANNLHLADIGEAISQLPWLEAEILDKKK